MALTSATKVIQSALENTPTSGYSICYNGNDISHSQKWPFHLPQLAITSAVTHVAVPSAALVATSAYTNVVIPFHHMAITSANSHCGYSICHSQKYHQAFQMWFFIFHKQIMWLFHLTQWQKTSAISEPHGKQHLSIKPSGYKLLVTTTFVTANIMKGWLNIFQNITQNYYKE